MSKKRVELVKIYSEHDEELRHLDGLRGKLEEEKNEVGVELRRLFQQQ